jgi:predicted phosphodiesterase
MLNKINSEGRIEITLVNKGKIVLAIIADAHDNYEYLQRVVNEILAHPNWKVVINGDLWDADQYSTHPTEEVLPLKKSIQKTIEIMKPIFPQILAFVWGNHEARCFRGASGKGTMVSPFEIFFQAWKQVKPDAQVCEIGRSLILNINNKRFLIKHGHSAGKTFGVMEFRDVLTTNEDLDGIIMSHTHVPEYTPVKRTTNDKPRLIHLIRTCAGVEFLGYQDNSNFFVSPIGLTKVIIGQGIHDVDVDLGFYRDN